MTLTGGGARGAIVAQTLVDILETTLVTPDHVEEATSIAAALIAGVGVGAYKDFDAVGQFIHPQKCYTPNGATKAPYTKAKQLFDLSYNALLPLYELF